MSDATFEYGGKPTAPTSEPTILERLRERLGRDTKRPDVLIGVPDRPEIAIQISPNITQTQMRQWRKNAGEDTRTGLDTLKMSCILVSQLCTGIFVEGEEVIYEDHPVSFASPEIMEMVGATRPVPDCVQKVFGNDAHVEAAALKIMELAGWGEGVEEVDPLKT